MSFISLAKRQDAKDLLTEDLNSLLKTAPEDLKEVFLKEYCFNIVGSFLAAQSLLSQHICNYCLGYLIGFEYNLRDCWYKDTILYKFQVQVHFQKFISKSCYQHWLEKF